MIGSAWIPAEMKGQPKKGNISHQTPFNKKGVVGVVWGQNYIEISHACEIGK